MVGATTSGSVLDLSSGVELAGAGDRSFGPAVAVSVVIALGCKISG